MARELVRTIVDKRKNYIINGDMRIAQRGTSFASIANAAYSLDRWRYQKSGAMIHTVSQGTDVPTFAQAKYLFQNSYVATLTTPDTSIAASESCRIEQSIEGFNFANFAQKTFTVSFWVKATLSGTYCVSVRNIAADRSCVQEFTINSSNTWEYKTVTFPASPSDGTWDYGTGTGLVVAFCLAAGTDFQTTAGAWQVGNFFKTSNQVNGVNIGATSFLITGVMVNEGDSASPFRTFGEDFGAEIVACQRYYEKSYALTANPGSTTYNGTVTWRGGASSHYATVAYSTKKRVAATVTFYSPENGASGNAYDRTSLTNRAIGADTNAATGFNSVLSGSATGNLVSYHWTAESEL